MRTNSRPVPVSVQQALFAADHTTLHDLALKGAAKRRKIKVWQIQRLLRDMEETRKQANEDICPVD
jgi:hypothetical protein